MVKNIIKHYNIHNITVLFGIPVITCVLVFLAIYLAIFFDVESLSLSLFILIFLIILIIVICWLWFAWAFQRLEEITSVSKTGVWDAIPGKK